MRGDTDPPFIDHYCFVQGGPHKSCFFPISTRILDLRPIGPTIPRHITLPFIGHCTTKVGYVWLLHRIQARYHMG